MIKISDNLKDNLLGTIGSRELQVELLNILENGYTLSAGTNVTLTPSGNTLVISATGGGGGGASTDLSNLASTKVNADIIPAVANTTNLGSAALPYFNTFTREVTTRQIFDSTGPTLSVSPHARQLVDSTGATVMLSWGTAGSLNAGTNNITNTGSILPATDATSDLGSPTGPLGFNHLWVYGIGNGNLSSNIQIDLNTSQIFDGSHTLSIDYASRTANDQSGIRSINYDLGRQLIANDGTTPALDWSVPGVIAVTTNTAAPAGGTLTLTNAPTGISGNPVGYARLTINGVVRTIPFW